ncbi:hypothetical protein FACS189487_00040 [Campylobacterota bacterium]|nr:hypothetical protein FACS189487_00040 [Campylobacterota bacterium]
MKNKPQVSKELLLPNEREREQIFHLLKKQSSYTAWKRIFGYYQAWANVAEASVRKADKIGLLGAITIRDHRGNPVASDKTDIGYKDYDRILKGLAYFEEGVKRLERGDKRVFTYSDVYGYFGKASVARDIWETLIIRGETQWDPSTPYLEEFMKCLKVLGEVWSECRQNILEDRHIDGHARCTYGLWEQIWLPRLPYPNPLPKVPEPSKNILVATGKKIPYSGIWEPVNSGIWEPAVEADRTSHWFFGSKPIGAFKIIGTMNYLHGGIRAPQARVHFINSKDYSDTNVEWRLIWRDDRYEDGTIPEEEKDYLFIEPVPQGVDSPYTIGVERYLYKHGFWNKYSVIPPISRFEEYLKKRGLWELPTAAPLEELKLQGGTE